MESHNLENPQEIQVFFTTAFVPILVSRGHSQLVTFLFFSDSGSGHSLPPAFSCTRLSRRREGKNSHVYMESQLRKFTYFDGIENLINSHVMIKPYFWLSSFLEKYGELTIKIFQDRKTYKYIHILYS